MGIFTINVESVAEEPAKIENIVDSIDNCETSKTFTLNIPNGTSKHVSILQSGKGSSYIGEKGIINSGSYYYELKILGDNDKELISSGTIIFIVRDKQNGIIEQEITLTRAHSNEFCSPITT